MYQARRNSQYGGRFRPRPTYLPYDKAALAAHKRLAQSLYVGAFGLLATSNKNGMAWVKKEMIRLQKIAYKRELKK